MRKVGSECSDIPNAKINCVHQRGPAMNAPIVDPQKALERVEHILYWAIDRVIGGTEHNSMASCDDHRGHMNIVVQAFGSDERSTTTPKTNAHNTHLRLPIIKQNLRAMDPGPIWLRIVCMKLIIRCPMVPSLSTDLFTLTGCLDRRQLPAGGSIYQSCCTVPSV